MYELEEVISKWFFVCMSSPSRYSTSGRLVGLLVTMAVGSAVLFLPIFGIVAFEQMLYFAGRARCFFDLST